MRMIARKIVDDNTVIEYFDDGSKRQLKGLNGFKIGCTNNQNNGGNNK